MAIGLLLGKDQFTIDPNIKYPAGAWDHVPAFNKDLNFAFFQDVVRQTDGNRCVVSSRAVFNNNVHQSLLHGASPLIQQIYDNIKGTLDEYKKQAQFLRFSHIASISIDSFRA